MQEQSQNKFIEAKIAENYLNYLSSKDGQFQQKFLSEKILKSLELSPGASVLDAGCGSGWMTSILNNSGYQTQGVDSSELLLKEAQNQFPGLEFVKADLTLPLPFTNKFDAVVLNMSAQDVSNIEEMFKNIASALKPGGVVVVTIPNPDFSFPKAVWKRSFLGKILHQKPRLVFPEKKYSPKEGKPHSSFVRETTEYSEAAKKAGLEARPPQELRAEEDAHEFGLNYQLFRYPVILLLKFKKRLE